ncbi:hypothetical protein EIN_044470 [Entamoeba invadens IP1]|uniref:Non-canonical E2 ubiquitin-conjugating enzyme C-terminal domain-containing protein n=1 Tax=Entamoeba invadens IP1 TaxID=370355 RepID=A0A0A1TZA8_ENTIV|nr:hypothetical protein EIN_044470 [Entamoeba invadens IP1]ELP86889.1 hypothetical protein EIN_044470 [Entamoeba invadens IP1]|eukprot:XP_004253660.1 hypothetical protein EIN_044470 [Entamoeba invadens IP1]
MGNMLEDLSLSSSGSPTPNDSKNNSDKEILHDEMDDKTKYSLTYRDYLERMPLASFVSFSSYQPMRLSPRERILLDVLESALDVSEYVNNVDVSRSEYGMYYFGSSYFYSSMDVSINKYSKATIIKAQHEELRNTLIGLMMSYNYKECLKIINKEELFEDFLQDTFEVGRRFKIANPHLLRTTYQEMMHILQDAILYNPSFIGKNFEKTKKFKEILTVGKFAKENNMMGIFNEECFKIAVLPTDEKTSNGKKEEARRFLINSYGENTERLLLSVSDGFAAASANCGVVHQMLKDLQERFTEQTKYTDLTIRYGTRGSCLSHSHAEQLIFVSQSLTLWWNVMQNMPHLWEITDAEFLSGTSYRLVNTGQGLQRMQSAPNVSGAMYQILSHTQTKLCTTGWRGLSVVHMGDQDVPNCLFFIDKYSQVPWIVSPIVKTATRVFKDRDPRLEKYFERISRESWSTYIYGDFFKHGFDGSGSDGGSCIDGRLTSAWNWCSMIEKYLFYPLFLTSDFEGFCGPYKK